MEQDEKAAAADVSHVIMLKLHYLNIYLSVKCLFMFQECIAKQNNLSFAVFTFRTAKATANQVQRKSNFTSVVVLSFSLIALRVVKQGCGSAVYM